MVATVASIARINRSGISLHAPQKIIQKSLCVRLMDYSPELIHVQISPPKAIEVMLAVLDSEAMVGLATVGNCFG